MIKGTNLRPFDRIAFVGQMGAGKDAIAEELPHDIFKFASGIRECVKILRTEGKVSTMDFLEDYLAEHTVYDKVYDVLRHAQNIPRTLKDRSMEQFLGTSLRKLYDSIWVDYTFREMRKSTSKKIALTDVRRLIELNTLRQEGFILFYVDAPYEVRLQRCAARDEVTPEEFLEASQHEAEREIESLKPLCDYVIDNSGESLEYANTQIYRIMKGGCV